MKDPQHNLNFMLVVSFGQSGFNSSGVIPAADIALEDINNDPNVLPGYNLTYDRVRDSQVSSIIMISPVNRHTVLSVYHVVHGLDSWHMWTCIYIRYNSFMLHV